MTTTSLFQLNHWRALCIALASSTDNVLVGVSLGMGKDRFIWWILVVGIAVINAIGAGLSTLMGAATSHLLYLHPNALAGMAFLALAYNEMCATSPAAVSTTSLQKSRLRQVSSMSQSVLKMAQLAVPMTLNNLAGGVATGVAGVPPLLAAVYVLIVSVVGMAGGLVIGNAAFHRKQPQQQTSSSAPTTTAWYCWINWSAVLYAALGIHCCVEAGYN